MHPSFYTYQPTRNQTGGAPVVASTSTHNAFQAADAQINVKDFGAQGNGATNDSQSIQNAIDSLPVIGGTVVVPIGFYMATNLQLDGSNHDKSNVCLKGMGNGSCIMKPAHTSLANDTDRRSNVIQATSGNGFQIYNLKVVGNMSRGGLKPPYCTKHQNGDTFSSTGRVICTNTDGTSSHGGATDRIFIVTKLGAYKKSDSVNMSADLKVGYVTEVTNQPFNESTGTGYINSYKLDNDYAFRACIYMNGLTAQMEGVLIQANDATDSVNGCILIGSGPLFASLVGFGSLGARIISNHVYAAGATCIGGGNKVGAVIANNVIGQTTSSGIRCDGGSHHCSVMNNYIDTVLTSSANGCISAYQSDYVTIVGNQCQHALAGVTFNECDFGDVTGNMIVECSNGIIVGSMLSGVISSNNISKCINSGIFVNGGQNLTITSNTVTKCGKYGIYLGNCPSSSIVSNNCQDNKKEGIYIDDGSNGSSINANQCVNNGNAGISINGVNNNIICTSNQCTDTHQVGARTQQYGIYASKTTRNSIFTSNILTKHAVSPIELNNSPNNINSGNLI